MPGQEPLVNVRHFSQISKGEPFQAGFRVRQRQSARRLRRRACMLFRLSDQLRKHSISGSHGGGDDVIRVCG
jgi:hypothetical protein